MGDTSDFSYPNDNQNKTRIIIGGTDTYERFYEDGISVLQHFSSLLRSHETKPALSVASSGLSEDKAAHFSQQVTFHPVLSSPVRTLKL